MAVYIGSPNHKHAAWYQFATLFLVIALIAIPIAWLSLVITTGLGRGIFRILSAVTPLTVMMAIGLPALAKRRKKAKLERVVDKALGPISPDHLVFCGRGWTGETAERDSVGGEDSNWELTAGKGRPLAGISSDRVIIGPSGVWLIAVKDSLTPETAASARGEAREASLALRRFLQSTSFCDNPTPETFAVRLMLVAVEQQTALDLDTGASMHLESVPTVIARTPRGLSLPNQRALVVALASNYTATEKGHAIDVMNGLAARFA